MQDMALTTHQHGPPVCIPWADLGMAHPPRLPDMAQHRDTEWLCTGMRSLG